MRTPQISTTGAGSGQPLQTIYILRHHPSIIADTMKVTITQPPPIPHVAPTTTPSPQQLKEIATARVLGRKVRCAASIATGSAWTIAFFGAVTVITSIGSWPGFALGVGMCVLSYFEFKGAREIRQLNPQAPRRLARNQVLLGAAVTIYAVVSLVASLSSPGVVASAVGQDAQAQQMLGSFIELERALNVIVYGVVILAAVLGCGGTALYYMTRQRHIESYVRQTPKWIVELQRAGMMVS